MVEIEINRQDLFQKGEGVTFPFSYFKAAKFRLEWELIFFQTSSYDVLLSMIIYLKNKNIGFLFYSGKL